MRIGNKRIPLNALHAFEAAGRHLNMGQAATELSVTQSAISHQVRNLEEQLDVQLFDRSRKQLALTAAGQRHGVPIGNGVVTVDTIEQAIERAGTKAGNKGEEATLAVIEMVNLLRRID